MVSRGTGDQGTTSLYGGQRVAKTDWRMDAIGDFDELNCVLGVARQHVSDDGIREQLRSWQVNLFILNAELATPAENLGRLGERIDVACVKLLDETVGRLEARVPAQRAFVVPGKSTGSAYLHWARAVCRRAERRVVALFERQVTTNEYILAWSNRLSLCLYYMACLEDHNDHASG